MFTLTCSNCEKKFKYNNNFNRHVTHCRICRDVQRRILKHDDLNDSMMIDDEYNNDDVNMSMNQIDANNLITKELSKDDVEKYFQWSMNKQSSIFSTSSSVKVKTYEKSTNRKIDFAMHAEFDSSKIHERRSQSFFSFHDEKNYALILWFHESTCTKKNIDRFFENERLISLHKELNFHNVDQWLKQFDQISHDSKKSRWANQNLDILSKCENESMTNVNFNYQNSKNDIRFLLDHKSFESHFSYSFVRQYNDDDERIFNEMHIDDWWWKTQKKFSKQTTIISILIAIDKIMLTQHHDDISIWSVYMIIENLSRNIRRFQTRSSSVLLDFISIVNSSINKIIIWHEVMSIMLKRKYMTM
jgi:hypothetical protein